MAFPSPPPAPQRGDRTTFSGRVDAFLLWLVALVPQMNTFLASLTTLAAGGANAFAYTFDALTANSDPGSGKVRFDSATQNAANTIRLDNLAANGGDVTAFLAALQAGTSNVKASLRLQKVSDPTVYLLFDITAVVVATGYINLTVTPRTSSAVSPFAANDTLILFFDPKGDKGDGGGTPTAQQIRDAVGTLGFENGGTAATTASAALANLGGLPKTGGDVSGNITFNNAVGLRGKDTGGTSRPIVSYAADNVVRHVNGLAGFTRWYNTTETAIIMQVDNSGNVMPFGNAQFNNNTGIYARDSGGTLYQQLVLASDNNTYITNAGGQNIYVQSRSGTILVTINNTGVVTATSFTSTSDERLKTNWRRLTEEQLDALAALEDVGLFDWIDGSGTALGGSAQQIQAIIPQVVHANAKGELSVDYSALAFVIAQSALRRARTGK